MKIKLILIIASIGLSSCGVPIKFSSPYGRVNSDGESVSVRASQKLINKGIEYVIEKSSK